MKYFPAVHSTIALGAFLGFAVAHARDASPLDFALTEPPCTLVYTQDFASDPGWITDDPSHLAWHVSQTFHGIQTNRDGTYAYVELPSFNPNASWRLEWDHVISACHPSAALDVGLFDSRLSFPYGAGLDMGITGSGSHGTTLVGGGATTTPTYSPVWAEGLWYHNVMAYDAPGQRLTLTITARSSGFLFFNLSLPVASFPSDMTRLGVSRLPMKGLTNGVNPAARVEFNLDNIRLCQSNANRPPVALCRDTNVAAGAACSAPASVDAGSFDPDGDALTVTQAPPGPYPLGTTVVTLTVTDARGASNSCTSQVTVVDAAPPSILCPPNMAVEPERDAGAVVTFTATAADACSDPTIVCTPASGSVFPVGRTTVACVATDAAGNAASCQFEVTVLAQGAREMKEGVLADLQVLAADATTAVDHKNLEQAIQRLASSLDASYWVDSDRLVWPEGNQVFNEGKDAVNRLDVLLRSPKSALEPHALLGLIIRLVHADRSLATVSLQDAAAAGVDADLLAPAMRAMQAGDAAGEDGKSMVADLHYRNAWRSARQVMADCE